MKRNIYGENNSASSGPGGIGFLGALAILFIALKLMGFITWSWWWVLAPIWVPILIGALLLLIIWALTRRT